MDAESATRIEAPAYTEAHHVKVVGPVRFHVEFLKDTGETGQPARLP